ncbi:UNVERIFIED_CONTAM: hypothetical protein FKN15_060198 [Acipenser sinensis]
MTGLGTSLGNAGLACTDGGSGSGGSSPLGSDLLFGVRVQQPAALRGKLFCLGVARALSSPQPVQLDAYSGLDQHAVSRATTGRGADSIASHGPSEASLPSPRLCPGLLDF